MKRDVNLDLIRSLAVFLVISVHFLSYIGMYDYEIKGGGMLVASILRVAFIACVPLFLLLSGWLQCKKKPTKQYYWGIIRILIAYVLCGVICQCFNAVAYRDTWSFKGAVLSFLDFTAAPYGWYIGMYIGLYMLIPFINILWENLRVYQKRVFLVSLLCLTAVPSIFNNFNFSNSIWYHASLESYTMLVSDWWQMLYPITYYCIGAFLRENKKSLVKKKNWTKGYTLCLVGTLVLLGGVII